MIIHVTSKTEVEQVLRDLQIDLDPIAFTLNMTDEEFKASRKGRIGGSDVGALMGLDRWRSSLDLFLEKTGEQERVIDDEARERMKWGVVMEDVILRQLDEKMPHYYFYQVKWLLANKLNSWQTLDLDGIVVDDQENKMVLEIKTSAHPEFFEDGIPPHYYAQVQWYMHHTGLKKTMFVVLCNGNKLITKFIEIDDIFIQNMLNMAYEFNEKLKRGERPDPDGSEAYSKAIGRLYSSKPNKEFRTGTEELDRLFGKYSSLKESIEKMQTELDTYKQSIQSVMQDTYGVETTHFKAVWPYIEKTVVNEKLLKAKYPAIYNELSKPNNYRGGLKITSK